MLESLIEFFKRLLFESPLLLVVVLGGVGAFLFALWQRQPSKGLGRIIVGLAFLGAVLLVVQKLVITDREAINILIGQLADAAERGDAAFITNHLDVRYAGDGYDRKSIAVWIEHALSQVTISDLYVYPMQTSPSAVPPMAVIRAFCHIQIGRVAYQMVASRWELRFHKRSDGWKLSHLKPLKIGPRTVEGVGDIYF